MNDAMQIGVYKLEEATTFRNTYETAAWYQDVLVQPGEFPVYGRINYEDLTPQMSPGSLKDTSVGCKVKGRVVGSDFSSLFAGNRVSSKIDEEVGMEAEHYIHPYAHSIALAILEGKPTRFILNDKFHARYTHYVYDGELKRSAGIFKKDEDVVWHVQQHTDEDVIVLYARKKGEIVPFIAYQNHHYLFGTMNNETKEITFLQKEKITEKEGSPDVFYQIRKDYLAV